MWYWSEAKKLAIVGQDGMAIRRIKNPSFKMQLIAVKQNGLAIEYVKDPLLEVQLEAVGENGLAIQYIENPSLEVQLRAVKQDGLAIEYEIQLEAVKQNGQAICWVADHSEEILFEALRNLEGINEFLQDPDYELRDNRIYCCNVNKMRRILEKFSCLERIVKYSLPIRINEYLISVEDKKYIRADLVVGILERIRIPFAFCFSYGPQTTNQHEFYRMIDQFNPIDFENDKYVDTDLVASSGILGSSRETFVGYMQARRVPSVFDVIQRVEIFG